MLIQYFPTPNNTVRLTLCELPRLVAYSERLTQLKTPLNTLCCWGGYDKHEFDKQSKYCMYSWEFNPKHGPSVLELAKRSLSLLFPEIPVRIED